MSVAERADFSYIRYSNCWEDSRVLYRGLGVRPGGRYLSITSAGDNTLALLAGNPERILAVDLNPAQTALAALKTSAFAGLNHGEMLRFLGFRHEDRIRRIEIYQHLSPLLPSEERAYWDQHLEEIGGGVIHLGKFERYFRIFRSLVIPLIHSRSTVTGLLEPRDREGRERFYREEWDTPRWRGMFSIFFSRLVMGRLGRDPEFFRQVEGSVARRILARTRYALTALPVADNPWVRYIMTGSFGDALPEFARPENFDAISRNVGAIEFCTGDILSSGRPDERFDGMNLSDIFEYMSPEESIEFGRRLVERLRPEGRMVYWEMLARRDLAELLSGGLTRMDQLSDELHLEDRAFFYRRLHVMQAESTGTG